MRCNSFISFLWSCCYNQHLRIYENNFGVLLTFVHVYLLMVASFHRQLFRESQVTISILFNFCGTISSSILYFLDTIFNFNCSITSELVGSQGIKYHRLILFSFSAICNCYSCQGNQIWSYQYYCLPKPF